MDFLLCMTGKGKKVKMSVWGGEKAYKNTHMHAHHGVLILSLHSGHDGPFDCIWSHHALIKHLAEDGRKIVHVLGKNTEKRMKA